MEIRFKKFGICVLTTMPIYRHKGKKSEIISELLFGETYEALIHDEGRIYISMSFDNLMGWIDELQFYEIALDEFNRCNSEYAVTFSPLEAISSNDYKRFISMGSNLPQFDGLSFKLDKVRFNFSGDVVPNLLQTDLNSLVKNLAKKLLFIPERKGGRSILGMDNDGFIQFVFKLLGIKLPRKAQHQARKGKIVHFVHEAQIGDVAYFADPKNRRIFHTGLIIENHKIIHVHGYIRMDELDHVGIYNLDQKRYTHHLRTIRRFIK